MIWKLLRVAEKAWRPLEGSDLLQEVYAGQNHHEIENGCLMTFTCLL